MLDLVLLLVSLLGGGDSSVAPATVRSGGPTTVVAAGDIASCETKDDTATARLVRKLDPDAVLTLGDNAYPNGTLDEFRRCYAPTWGSFRSRTYPAPGNHDYATPGASGYFAYFGARAPGPYYSFDLGGWHIVSLNSEIPHGWGSRQARWFTRDLRGARQRCELAFWHRPRWSGGRYSDDPGFRAFWRIAYLHGVDLVLVGHDHNYQRFRPLDGAGKRDGRHGVVQVVAGTGGRGHHELREAATRVVAIGGAHGVVELTLRPRGYDLRFVPVEEGGTDSLTRRCHGAPMG